MKTEYLSLTQAIDIFEEHKQKKIQSFVNKPPYIRNYDYNDADPHLYYEGENDPRYQQALERKRQKEAARPMGLFEIFITEGDITKGERAERFHWKQTASLLDLIHEEILPLYGNRVFKDLENGISESYKIIPVCMVPSTNWDCPYYICNNYDYMGSYNPGRNYDILRERIIEKDIYINLSVKYDELLAKMKDIEAIITIY
jgi:hypothetical protein